MFKKISFFALIVTMIAAASLTANENTHVQVGVRAESIENRMANLETRSAMAALYPEGKNEIAQKNIGMMARKGFLKPKISYALHHASYQTATFTLLPETNEIMAELMDGSIWFIDPYEMYALTYWNPSDPVIITQNHAWGSSYAFRLTNQTTGQSIGINIYLGPIAPIFATHHTRWITGIDYYKNVIQLSDHSVWNMSMFDASTVNNWAVGDIVIVGVNDGWLFAYNPNMLINVATLDFGVGAAY